jgi:hypothetical protein
VKLDMIVLNLILKNKISCQEHTLCFLNQFCWLSHLRWLSLFPFRSFARSQVGFCWTHSLSVQTLSIITIHCVSLAFVSLPIDSQSPVLQIGDSNSDLLSLGFTVDLHLIFEELRSNSMWSQCCHQLFLKIWSDCVEQRLKLVIQKNQRQDERSFFFKSQKLEVSMIKCTICRYNQSFRELIQKLKPKDDDPCNHIQKLIRQVITSPWKVSQNGDCGEHISNCQKDGDFLNHHNTFKTVPIGKLILRLRTANKQPISGIARTLLIVLNWIQYESHQSFPHHDGLIVPIKIRNLH